jgi:DNA helicase HerA-like ATPase
MGKLSPIIVLSLDFAWQNPLVARRLPPLRRILRGIYIGKTEGGIPISWSPFLAPNNNITIIGPMGTGKTTLVMTFLYRAYKMLGIPTWVFDIAGEYVSIIQKLGGIIIDLKKDKVNPFVLYGSDPVSIADNVTKMCTYLIGLRGFERFFLRETILKLYRRCGISPENPKTWSDRASNNVSFDLLRRYLEDGLRKSIIPKEDRQIVKSILEKVKIFATGAYKLSKASFSLDTLYKLRKPICFLLRGLPSYVQKVIVWTLLEQLHSLFYNRYKLSDELRLFLVIEEAHIFSRSEPADVPSGKIDPPLAEYIRSMRKLGHGVICITHKPTDLDSLFLEAVGTLIMFGSTDAHYVDFCRKQLHLPFNESKRLLWMKKGECYIRFYADARSVLVKVDPEDDVLGLRKSYDKMLQYCAFENRKGII